jgi:hypothetical protein
MVACFVRFFTTLHSVQVVCARPAVHCDDSGIGKVSGSMPLSVLGVGYSLVEGFAIFARLWFR